MYFNLDLIQRKLFTRRGVIADDFGVEPAAETPCDFADQIITALAQFAVRDPMRVRIGNENLFEAACLAIWSSGADWRRVIERREQLAELLHEVSYQSKRSRCGVPTSRPGPGVEGERRGKPQQGRAGDRPGCC